MEIPHGSKGFYRITLGLETTHNDASEKSNWNNKNDSTCSLVVTPISIDLQLMH